ncbi:cell death abnormality protein 1-like, partial [Saccostrea cucullata]|uniref:cell death abnormality protein 1-like n=1 Tax=Saccostrea cuccullata TaxID=36930 RepID=UPI002ED3B994
MKRILSLIFLYLVYLIIPKGIIIANNEKGVCSSKTAEKECCINYYQENGLCKVCPSGWFGKNCSQQCPKNTYGELCDRSCNCKSNETCNHVLGCLPKTGVCLGKIGEFGCCLNYFQRIKNKCSVCNPGTYAENCNKQCPNETYGYQCRQKCNCSVNITCDKQFGCVDQ